MKERCQNDGVRVGLVILALAVFALAPAGCACPGPTGCVVVSEDALADAAPSLETEPTPVLAGEAQIAKLVEGNTRFALDLYLTLFDAESNLFYSPHGLASALAMKYAGARGETERQMVKAHTSRCPKPSCTRPSRP
jgi:serpin B